ncbi:MAG TPA: RNB domain-containing ribonuclease, partial [Bryobacteraceae bacterium]|nr:RNB domain-containing ribonuclease [Bryobacteraceae bacterium]
MSFDLRASAREEMIREGFDPDFSPSVEEQIKTIRTRSFTMAGNGVRDLRDRLWSSIDNQTSHDLDQVEFAERVDGGIRVLIG